MKILHLNASSSGGAFVVAQRLSDALNAMPGIESKHLVYTGIPGNYKLWSDTYFRKKYAFAKHALEKLDFLRFEKDASVRFAFSHGLTGINIASNPLVLEADIIHLHWINKGFISLSGLEKLLKLNKPVVWTCHDMWPFSGGCYYSGNCDNYLRGCGNCKMLKNPGENDLSFKIKARKTEIFSKANNLYFITPSEWLAKIGRASGTAGNKEIRTIPNAIDIAQFTPENRAESRIKTGIDVNKKVLLFAAVNIADKRKGFNEFLQVLDYLYNAKVENIEVVYIGENKGNINQTGPFPHRFTGFINNPNIMADWYRSGDLYITTSNDDNLPTTIMESLACGTPVAAFRTGGIPEMVEQGETGVLSGVYKSEELGENIVQLLSGKFGSNADIANRCRLKAEKNYSAAVVSERHLSLYQSLL